MYSLYPKKYLVGETDMNCQISIHVLMLKFIRILVLKFFFNRQSH